MTTVASEYCNDKGWSHTELIFNTKKRIEEVQKCYYALFNVITHDNFNLSEDLSVVTETFNHAFEFVRYKLERLKVILKLLNKGPTLAQCVLDKNTIDQLIDEYNKRKSLKKSNRITQPSRQENFLQKHLMILKMKNIRM